MSEQIEKIEGKCGKETEMDKLSQATVIGRELPTTWAGWRERLLSTFLGGYTRSDNKHLLPVYQHGINTVFNWLEDEMAHLPPIYGGSNLVPLDIVLKIVQERAEGFSDNLRGVEAKRIIHLLREKFE